MVVLSLVPRKSPNNRETHKLTIRTMSLSQNKLSYFNFDLTMRAEVFQKCLFETCHIAEFLLNSIQRMSYYYQYGHRVHHLTRMARNTPNASLQ